MPPLGDAEELSRYQAVLDEAGRFAGCFDWKPIAADEAREFLGNWTPRGIEQLICEHRDEVKQKEEKREEHSSRFQFYYGLVVVIGGIKVFIETVFMPGSGRTPDRIRVVSIHPTT